MPLIYLPDTDIFLDTASIEKLEPSEVPPDDLHEEARLSVTVTLRNAPWIPPQNRGDDHEQIAEVYEGKDAEVLFRWAKVEDNKTKEYIDNEITRAALKKSKKQSEKPTEKPATMPAEAEEVPTT